MASPILDNLNYQPNLRKPYFTFLEVVLLFLLSFWWGRCTLYSFMNTNYPNWLIAAVAIFVGGFLLGLPLVFFWNWRTTSIQFDATKDMVLLHAFKRSFLDGEVANNAVLMPLWFMVLMAALFKIVSSAALLYWQIMDLVVVKEGSFVLYQFELGVFLIAASVEFCYAYTIGGIVKEAFR